ncbi:MAG: hypothetical protein JKX95_05160 [Bacteroidia bacterium]|nr:hypothetical protein [Bacteroidia bacterium]
MKRFLTAVVALLLVTTFSFAGGPFDNVKKGEITRIELTNGKHIATVMVIENQNRMNYTVLLKPLVMKRKVISKVGEKIDFNLYTGAGGGARPFDGIEKM